MVAVVEGNVIVVPSVPARVSVFDAESVLPLVIVRVPVEEVMVRPLMVLFVRASEPARVAKVPVVGRVTLVAPVVVSVKLFAPDVMKSAAKVRLPETITVLAASPGLIVKSRLAVRLEPVVRRT